MSNQSHKIECPECGHSRMMEIDQKQKEAKFKCTACGKSVRWTKRDRRVAEPLGTREDAIEERESWKKLGR